MLTKARLRRFLKRRNGSDFHTNLQFQIDANAEGFSVDDLGRPRKFSLDGFTGYEWRVPLSGGETARLVEFGRRLHLEGAEESDEMFELMAKAEFAAEPLR